MEHIRGSMDAHTEDNHNYRKRWLRGWLLLAVTALIAAFLSAGGGHGDYLFVTLFFPITMYVGIIHQMLVPAMVILLLVQYPVIAVLPFVFSWRKVKCICILMAIVHVTFVSMVSLHPE